MARREVVFDDFSKGEYGSLNPATLGKGWFSGDNVVRLTDGSLCPRAGEKAYILTGVVNGVLEGLGSATVSDTSLVWLMVGGAVREFTASNFASQASVAYTGSVGASVSLPVQHVRHGNNAWAFVYPRGLYKIDTVARTIATVAGSPTLAASCALHKGWLIAGGSNGRVYYSDDADFTTWGANAYFDPGGEGSVIQAVRNLRGQVAIGQWGFMGDRWWMMSGDPGVNHSVRSALVSPIPTQLNDSADVGTGVGFIAESEACPAIFDGSRVTLFSHLSVKTLVARDWGTEVPPEATVFALRRQGEWGILTTSTADTGSATGRIWLFHNGCWTKHSRSAGVAAGGWALSLPIDNRVIFAGPGAAGSAAPFCSWNPYLERPPFDSDAGTTILAAASCTVTLPETVAPLGVQEGVRRIAVDFKKWNTGTNDNTFTIRPTIMRRYSTTDTISADTALAAQSWTEAAASSSTSGTQARKTFLFDATVRGGAWRIDFTALRGVAIQRVSVLTNDEPEPGVD